MYNHDSRNSEPFRDLNGLLANVTIFIAFSCMNSTCLFMLYQTEVSEERMQFTIKPKYRYSMYMNLSDISNL